jgi:hypothetical protein
MNYFNRGFAVAYLIGLAVWATSKVGQATSCEPISWVGAWLFVLVVAGAMAVGYLAHWEAKQ